MWCPDSKIDENHCKQNYELMQVFGNLYRYISSAVSDCNEIFTVIYLFYEK